MQSTYIKETVARALAEDLGPGDIMAALAGSAATVHAQIVCNEDATLAGTAWAGECFRQLQGDVTLDWLQEDGDWVGADTVICKISGQPQGVLSAERTALNFLQLLSGVATTTRRYVDAVSGTVAKILDTRETLPGLRLAQKYAVRCGGGHNHRQGLYDMALVKQGHILAAGGIGYAIEAARDANVNVMVECAVQSLEQLQVAVAARADRILLVGFDDAAVEEAVRIVNRKVPLEVVGGDSPERVAELARYGVEFISVAALTRDVHAVDFALRLL